MPARKITRKKTTQNKKKPLVDRQLRQVTGGKKATKKKTTKKKTFSDYTY